MGTSFHALLFINHKIFCRLSDNPLLPMHRGCLGATLPTSFGIGAAVGLLWVWPIGPRIKKRMEDKKVARASAEQTKNAGVSPAALVLVPTAVAEYALQRLLDQLLQSEASYQTHQFIQ